MPGIRPEVERGSLDGSARVVIRLLIDENLPVDLLTVPGAACEHATALSGQPSDLALWNYARAHGLVILTKDADFFDLLTLHGSPPKVVWIRTGNLRRMDLEMLMRHRWDEILELLSSADLVEVHADRLEALTF